FFCVGGAPRANDLVLYIDALSENVPAESPCACYRLAMNGSGFSVHPKLRRKENGDACHGASLKVIQQENIRLKAQGVGGRPTALFRWSPNHPPAPPAHKHGLD